MEQKQKLKFITKTHLYLTKSEIKKLKRDLMRAKREKRRITITRANSTSENSSEKVSSLVTKEVRKTINAEIGLIFEDNIRKTLEVEYKWKLTYIPRKFFYRDILFQGKIFFLSPFSRLTAKNFIINMNAEDNSCQFISKLDNKIKDEVKETETAKNHVFENKNFTIGIPKEVEFDGLYENFDFQNLSFDKEEVEILFRNTNINKYKFAVIEIKPNAYKIDELVIQLKADKLIMNKIGETDVIYLGFVNINRNDYNFEKELQFPQICGNLPCIILGIKNGRLCERNITFPVDWKIVEQFYSFKNEVKEEIKNIKSEIKELKEFVEEQFQDLKKELNNIQKRNKKT